jgi:hypothetical protein
VVDIYQKAVIRRKRIFHQAQAKLPFGEKIAALVKLQEIASSWGGKKDVIVWRI